jgi:hypothetical protein
LLAQVVLQVCSSFVERESMLAGVLPHFGFMEMLSVLLDELVHLVSPVLTEPATRLPIEQQRQAASLFGTEVRSLRLSPSEPSGFDGEQVAEPDLEHARGRTSDAEIGTLHRLIRSQSVQAFGIDAFPVVLLDAALEFGDGQTTLLE